MPSQQASAHWQLRLNGVFGRCQRYPVTDLYTYDVSPAALVRLRTILQKLAHRGYTWQDGTTQQVISKELSKIPKIPLGRSESPFFGLASNSRAPAANRDRKLKVEEAELGMSLQRYLQDLGFMPSYVTPSKLKGPFSKYEEDGRADLTDYVQPKTRGKPKSPFSFLSPRPPPSSSKLSKAGPNPQPLMEQPAQASSPFGGRNQDQAGLLLSELEQYLVGMKGSPMADVGRAQGKVQYFGRGRPGGLKGSSVIFRKFPGASKPPPPRTDRLFFKSGPQPPEPKEPLSLVDEKFIQGVVNQLGRQSVNVDALTPKDLDQLSAVITQALQVVDQNQNQGQVPGIKGREVTNDDTQGAEVTAKREQTAATSQAGDKMNVHGEDSTHREIQSEDVGPKTEDKDQEFLRELLEYLDHNSESERSGLETQKQEPFLGYNGSLAPPFPAGVENVQSRTTQTELNLPTKKEPGSTSLLVDLEPEVEQLMDEGSPGSEPKLQLEPQKKDMEIERGPEVEKKGVSVEEKLRVDVAAYSSPEKDFGYVITEDSLSTDQGLNLMRLLAERVKLHVTDFLQLSVLGPAVTFRVRPNAQNISTAQLARVAVEEKGQLERESGVKILEAGLSDRGKLNQIPVVKQSRLEPSNFVVLTVVSMVFIVVVVGLTGALYCLRHRSNYKLKKLASLGTDTCNDATATYQDLCRQRMAVQTSERTERVEPLHASHTSRINSVSSQFSDGPMASPSARSSTSSWSEEPAHTNMDISTGHMILSYMEDHLQNKDRLEKEWEALCKYQAEPAVCAVGQKEHNAQKNRLQGVLVYDHSRVILKAENNHGNSDYINASPIMDHDPRNPAYICAQGPLPSTVPDFWQMVWESGCVVIVMLTPLAENGTKQCHQYWPDEGSNLYHIYEVNLVSEHIWCEDFLVRSFYLKNVQTNETRTVTQFHFLSWMDQSIPESARTLLDFRRKVNKCYRGRSCPIIVHCSDGAGRSGTYILIDMVLNKMAKGAKEIDIAATLEHLRDQRAGMVQTKEQFEFALTAVAEEVNAILKALPQ
ncbi:receptor-type tyrosine-protein phosphatase N2 [Chanos chanos]|uniref:Receptor-type tyrosine-protein phosphatase N2 n=1 Tax=Chanos chanos TaxID=29144 RepID=A0A6J2VTH2_CHACN|nr:receptor-type tyrosine-protein phosphatase N2 [Chanos chanos]